MRWNPRFTLGMGLHSVVGECHLKAMWGFSSGWDHNSAGRGGAPGNNSGGHYLLTQFQGRKAAGQPFLPSLHSGPNPKETPVAPLYDIPWLLKVDVGSLGKPGELFCLVLSSVTSSAPTIPFDTPVWKLFPFVLMICNQNFHRCEYLYVHTAYRCCNVTVNHRFLIYVESSYMPPLPPSLRT